MNVKAAQLLCGAGLLAIGLLSLAMPEIPPIPPLALLIGGAATVALAAREELERSSICSLAAAAVWIAALLALGVAFWQNAVLLLLSLTPLAASAAAAASLSGWREAVEEEAAELAYIDEGVDFTLPKKLEEMYDFEFDEYGRLVKKK